MNNIHVGVIGVGYLGKFHAAKYAAMSGATLVGISDLDETVGRQLAAQFNTRFYRDYREMLDRCEAVSIVVPTNRHYEVASYCLERGVDVMIEKPMTTTLEEADLLLAKADSCQRLIQVGHVERFNPAIVAMEQYLTQPMFIEAQRLHPFKSRGVEVDVVLDLMIHDIDIITSIVPAPIHSIHAVGSPVVTATSDIANARLLFENGCTANLTVSRISRAQNIRKLRLFQAQSFISVDYGSKAITVVKRPLASGAGGSFPEETLHLSFTEDALEMQLKSFLLNVKERTAPKVDGREGRKVLAIALRIIEQIKGHQAKYPGLWQDDLQ